MQGRPVYNKIFTKILDSSVWLESDQTRLVWLTLIAAMDEDGFCQFASASNLAHRARVEREATEKAIATLEAPDSDSSDPDNEGRRIERVPGGWIVLNAPKYRDLVTRTLAREKTRERVAKHRNRKRSVTECNAAVTECNDSVTPSEAIANAHTKEQKPSRPKAASDPRYQPFVDVCQQYTTHFGLPFRFGAADGKQLKALLLEAPAFTAEEFKRCLWNRSRSDGITNGDAPRIYLPSITKYLEGPLDQYGKRKDGSAKQDQTRPSPATQRGIESRTNIAAAVARRLGRVPGADDGGNASPVLQPGTAGGNPGYVLGGMGGDGFAVRAGRVQGSPESGSERFGT
jgi:hypothetical protein